MIINLLFCGREWWSESLVSAILIGASLKTYEIFLAVVSQDWRQGTRTDGHMPWSPILVGEILRTSRNARTTVAKRSFFSMEVGWANAHQHRNACRFTTLKASNQLQLDISSHFVSTTKKNTKKSDVIQLLQCATFLSHGPPLAFA